MTDVIQVVIGIISNVDNQFLVAKRPDHVHLGGLWEFPGGKIEKRETQSQALLRELKEELNIDIHLNKSKHFKTMPYDYPEKSVLLHFWRVFDFKGKAEGKEGQPIQWVSLKELSKLKYPTANRPIIKLLLKGARHNVPGTEPSNLL